MIRGLYSNHADEVRVKLLHRTHGSDVRFGAWTALDRWLIETTFGEEALLLGVESDRETKKILSAELRGDLRIVVTAGGLFRERIEERVDLDVSRRDLADGPAYGVFWTMAAGFGSTFRASLSSHPRINGSLAKYLHDGPVLRDDGPQVVLYRNFLDDETCVRLRHEVWDRIARDLQSRHTISLLQISRVDFDGQTLDLTPSIRIDRE